MYPHSYRVKTGSRTRVCLCTDIRIELRQGLGPGCVCVYPHSFRVMTGSRTRACVCTHIRIQLRQGLGPGRVCVPTFV